MKTIRKNNCYPFAWPSALQTAQHRGLWLVPACLLLLTLCAASASAQTQVTIVNAASFASDSVLAPDSVAAAFGIFKTQNNQVYTAPGTPLPTTLGGVKVNIGGTDAQLLFVGLNQINLIIPGNLPDGTATVTVTNSDNTTSTGTVTIVRASPGIFTLSATGQGVPIAQTTTGGAAPLINVFNTDGTLRDVSAGTTAAPNFLVLYGTGFRNAPAASPNDANRVAEAVTATIQGLPADVLFAGPQGFAGVDQINLKIPPQLSGLGIVKIRLSVNGRPSNVTIIRIGGASPAVTTKAITPSDTGVSVNGALTSSSQVQSGVDGRTYFFDAYRFTTAAANTSIAIALNSNQFDAVLTLYKVSTGDNLTFIASDDQTGALGNGGEAPGNSNALLLATLPDAGDYIVFVSSADNDPDAVGSYSLSLRTNVIQAISYGNPPASPAITTSDVQTSAGDYLDAYSFSGTQGDQIVITMSSAAFDPFLILKKSNGDQVAFDDNSGGGLNARLTATLAETGTYYILATPFQPGVTGAYTLTLTKTNVPPSLAEPLAEAESLQRVPGRAQSADALERSRNLEPRYAVRHVIRREQQ